MIPCGLRLDEEEADILTCGPVLPAVNDALSLRAGKDTRPGGIPPNWETPGYRGQWSSRSGAQRGELMLPCEAAGIVILPFNNEGMRTFSSSRFLACELRKSGLASLLIEANGLFKNRDKDFFEARVEEVVKSLKEDLRTDDLNLGWWSSSETTAGLLRASLSIREFMALVLESPFQPQKGSLCSVQAPTLLIAAGNEPETVKNAEKNFRLLKCEKKLSVIQGAGRCFREPGKLVMAAKCARDWFVRNLLVDRRWKIEDGKR